MLDTSLNSGQREYGSINQHGEVEESTYLAEKHTERTILAQRIVLLVVVIASLCGIVFFVHSTAIAARQKDKHQIVLSPKCSDNILCNNIKGDCCPTLDGQFLGCCGVSERSCASNFACAAQKIEGDCCPTQEGSFLDCCP